ncbi:ABC-F family ATP-binding cassette domain-containing protein [Symbiobacterium thermophilum]|uniref:ABC transporter ATP-binding protein n=1 Tax=Symbiobacterium thermophilum (strain DSM 24528 / JCM 14929 / IAM 14863 / T) TaxID=292459 RepID=Q67QE6_SYMTH|nr:ABC-F family ATP-binding cassette domain-containing protein [Symbiobacterium thermophilum]BAD40097.1 ABC transporter ATP-binding protein [Symbiobacterium thermophilum IAM 14863]
MAILTVQGLTKYWGVDLLFKDISFLLNEGEKMALVGPNGAGKTTLLRILLGRMEYDEGRIIMPAGTRVAYLSQDPEFTPGRTVFQEARSVFSHLAKWERDLRELEARMGEAESEEALQAVMDEYTRVTALYEAAGAYDAPARTRAVLFGLGFTEADLEKPVEVLSGGQKVRLGLAKILLAEPDLMLLDEPTNHLDLQAVEWLEGYFRQVKSAAILVSHDRYFLDRVISRTLEIDSHTCDMYHGNYSYYVEEKKRRLEARLSAYERQQREAERLRTFYEKWRSNANRKGQAMSRKRQLEKMELMERPQVKRRTMRLSFDVDYESGDDVLVVEGLAKSFGDRTLFRNANLTVQKGDRIALVGPNGSGKTTFLKIIHGLVQPSAGSYRWGVGVQRGYFSQDLDDLDPSRTCLEEIMALPGFTRYDAHSLLGQFLFSGEDALKRIGDCSGGERNRLILAKLMVSGANVLLLDEPTNHLDLESKQVLEEALRAYPGTVLFVSHDRFFVDRIATHVWEFGQPEGIAVYEGNYTAYREEKERQALLAAQAAAAAGADGRAELPRSGAGQDGAGRRPARSRKEERKAAEAVRRLEAEIQRLEQRKAELEERMADPDIYRSATGREAVAEYNAVRDELERLYVEWEELAAELAGG